MNGLLRAFNGQFASGDWTLELRSTAGPLTLNEWSLTITEFVPDDYAGGFENQLSATVNSGGIQANLDPQGADNTIRYLANKAAVKVQYEIPATSPANIGVSFASNTLTVQLKTTDGKLSTADEVARAVNDFVTDSANAVALAGVQLAARVIGKGDGPVADLADFTDHPNFGTAAIVTAMAQLTELGGQDEVVINVPNVPHFTLNTLNGADTVTNIKQGGTELTINTGADTDKVVTLQGSTSNLVINAGPDDDEVEIYSVGGAPGFTDVFGEGGDDLFTVHLDRIADDGETDNGDVDLRIDGGSTGETTGDKLNYWDASLAFVENLPNAMGDAGPQFESDGFASDQVQVSGGNPPAGTLDYSEIENGMLIMPTQVDLTTPAPIFENMPVEINVTTVPTANSTYSFDLNGDGIFGDVTLGPLDPPTSLSLTASQLSSFGIDDAATPELILDATLSGRDLTRSDRLFTMMDKGKTVVLAGEGADTADLITNIAEINSDGSAKLALMADNVVTGMSVAIETVAGGAVTAYLPTSFPITVQLTSGTEQIPIFDYDSVPLVILNAPPVLGPTLTAQQTDGTRSAFDTSSATAAAPIAAMSAKRQPVTLDLSATDIPSDNISQWIVDWAMPAAVLPNRHSIRRSSTSRTTSSRPATLIPARQCRQSFLPSWERRGMAIRKD